MDWLKLVDLLAVKVGDKVKIKNNIPSANGMLYKDTKVKIDQFLDNNKVIVIDDVGKIWYTDIINLCLF